jgi:hypothetical protein
MYFSNFLNVDVALCDIGKGTLAPPGTASLIDKEAYRK